MSCGIARLVCCELLLLSGLLLMPHPARADDGRAAVAQMIQDLRSGDAKERWNAALGLEYSARHSDLSIPALTGALNDSDPNVRSKAAESLRKLRAATKASSRRAQSIATKPKIPDAEQQSRSDALQRARQLIEQREQQNQQRLRLATEARQAEVQRKQVAEQKLREQKLREQELARKKAEEIKIAEANLAEQRQQLVIKAENCRWSGADPDPSLLLELAAAIAGTDQIAQANAAYALALIGPEAATAVPQLVNLLSTSGDTAVRANSALALGQINVKTADVKVIRQLARALLDSEYLVRSRTAEALGFIGESARPAVSALTLLLDDPQEKLEVKEKVAIALGRIGIGTKDTIRSLAQALRTDNPDLKIFAAASLGELGPQAAIALDSLNTLSSSQDSDISQAANWAIKKIAAGNTTEDKS